MKRLRMVAGALAGLILAGFAAAQNPAAAKTSGKKSSPTVAAAQEFLDEAESRYFDLTNKAQRASWVEENFITDDTEEIAAQANQELSAFSAEMSRKAHEFDSLTLPTEMARKMLLLKLSAGFPAPWASPPRPAASSAAPASAPAPGRRLRPPLRSLL